MTSPDDMKNPCCHDRERVWLLEDIAVCGVYGGTIATHLLDQLPPAKALLFVRLALNGEARLERGTLADLINAANKAVGNASLSAPGWWTRHLDTVGILPVRRVPAPRPVNGPPAAARPVKSTART